MGNEFEFNKDIFEKIPYNPKNPDTYIGRTSHRLTVIDVYMRATEGKFRTKYCLCKCSCGKLTMVNTRGIRSQRIKSCGCWKSEIDSEKAHIMGKANYRHGESRSRIYKIWDKMRDRCDNPNAKSYQHYGGRGITYNPRWNDFEAFYEDMKDGYADNLTLERLSVHGDYTKENCTWVPNEDQAWNRTTTVYITFKGKDYNFKELSAMTGIPRRALYQRYKHGWAPEDIVNIPYRRKR